MIMIIIIVKEYVVLKQGIRQGRGTAFETVFYAWSLQSFIQMFARTYFYHLYMEMFLHIVLYVNKDFEIFYMFRNLYSYLIMFLSQLLFLGTWWFMKIKLSFQANNNNILVVTYSFLLTRMI